MLTLECVPVSVIGRYGQHEDRGGWPGSERDELRAGQFGR